MSAQVWTDAQFDEMSWHDNHVHALRLVETGDGAGDLILDVDHIVEWIKTSEGAFQFRILPVTLTFHEVMFLQLSLDYAGPTAAFTPFMIYGIERRAEQRDRYVAQLWSIPVSWPSGRLAFEARGFTQRGSGEPILTTSQCLTPEQRHRVA
jgi:hypothetical protein